MQGANAQQRAPKEQQAVEDVRFAGRRTIERSFKFREAQARRPPVRFMNQDFATMGLPAMPPIGLGGPRSAFKSNRRLRGRNGPNRGGGGGGGGGGLSRGETQGNEDQHSSPVRHARLNKCCTSVQSGRCSERRRVTIAYRGSLFFGAGR